MPFRMYLTIAIAALMLMLLNAALFDLTRTSATANGLIIGAAYSVARYLRHREMTRGQRLAQLARLAALGR